LKVVLKEDQFIIIPFKNKTTVFLVSILVLMDLASESAGRAKLPPKGCRYRKGGNLAGKNTRLRIRHRGRILEIVGKFPYSSGARGFEKLRIKLPPYFHLTIRMIMKIKNATNPVSYIQRI
jgi:hypothetical protein